MRAGNARSIPKQDCPKWHAGRRALGVLKWLVQIPKAEGRGRKERPIIHQKACHHYFLHSQPLPWSCQVFVGVRRPAQKLAAEVLAIIEWGTQHWKLQETFPVPMIPRWLRMPEFTQTTTLLRGELPLMPTGSHIEDIHMRCPAMWSWMAILLQYWQDHMTPYLYGGRFRRISDLAATVIRDINQWLPHQACFSWVYVAMNAMLWIDLRDHFAMEHQEEWTEQKEQECALNDLERDTEVVYRARIIRRQEDKLIADSKEAAVKNLPPERWAARAERQAGATPRKDDVSSTSMSATLYPDWVLSLAGKRSSPDTPQPYGMPREGAGGCLSLEEELNASSVFDPLQLSQGSEGPRMPPHYSETPTTIPPFDLAKVGVLPRMSPITDQENALLNIAPGSPVRCAAPPGLDWGQGGSGPSSCSDSPMSLGSPAPGSSLGLALMVCTWPVTPLMFGGREGLPRSTVEEDEEEMDATGSDDADQAQDWTHRDVHPASTPCSVRRRVESDSQPNGITKTTIWRKDTLLKWTARLFGVPPNHTSFYSRTRNTRPALLGGAPPCLKLVFFIGLVL